MRILNPATNLPLHLTGLPSVIFGTFLFIIFGAIGSRIQSALPEDMNISDAGYNAMRVAEALVLSWLLTLTGSVLGSFLAGVIV